MISSNANALVVKPIINITANIIRRMMSWMPTSTPFS